MFYFKYKLNLILKILSINRKGFCRKWRQRDGRACPLV